MAIDLKQTPYGSSVYRLSLVYNPPVMSKKTGKPVYEEVLKLSIYRKPSTPRMKLFNQDNLERADKILKYREGQIQRGEIRILKLPQGSDFVSFYRQIAESKAANYKASFLRFSDFCNGYMPFDRVSPELFLEYRDCLKKATYIESENPLSQKTAKQYFNQFRYVLREAFNAGYMAEDLHDCAEMLGAEEQEETLITIEELAYLLTVPCEHEDIPRMCFFIALTGFRFGFLMKLRWEDIVYTKDHRQFIMTKVQRTGRNDVLYISNEAMKQLGRKKKTGRVFSDNGRQNLKFLHRWLKSAGLRSELTFESFRLYIPRLPRPTQFLK